MTATAAAVDPADHLPLALSVAGPMMRRYPHLSGDLRAEAFLALVRAARGYRPELGWTFSTYATKAIWCRLVRAVVQDRPLGHRFRSDGPSVPMPTTGPLDDDVVADPGPDVSDAVDSLDAAEHLMAMAEGRAALALRLWTFEGLGPAEVADRLGVSVALACKLRRVAVLQIRAGLARRKGAADA